MKIILHHPTNGNVPFGLEDVSAMVRSAQSGDKFALAFRQKLEEALSVVEQYGEIGLAWHSISLTTPEGFEIAFVSDHIPSSASSMGAHKLRELLELVKTEQEAKNADHTV
jgi:hypothetical protein